MYRDGLTRSCTSSNVLILFSIVLVLYQCIIYYLVVRIHMASGKTQAQSLYANCVLLQYVVNETMYSMYCTE